MPSQAPRPTLLTVILSTLLLAPLGAQALGLGRPQVLSELGKPLDVRVPLTLADGEQLGESCMRAEVMAGDARVPAGLLQIRVEGEPGQQRIRLVSLVRIDEPALRITLALGCPLRLTREFNAFVDPPASASVAAPVVAAAPENAAPPPVSAPQPVAQVKVESAPRPAAKPRPRPRSRPSGPKLVLERPEVLVEAPSVQAAASAPTMEMTPELEAQIAALEQTVAQLRTELQARLQAEAASAPAAAASVAMPVPVAASPAASVRSAHYRDPLTWLGTLGLGLLAGAGAYHLSRWRDERRRRERAYWRAVRAAEGAGEPGAHASPAAPGIAPQVQAPAVSLPDEGQHTVTRPQPRPIAWPPAVAPVASAAPTPLATQPLHPETPPLLSQQLTVADELLDLCQQVDFLKLLGQQDAAADLLLARMKQAYIGAMPLLMLMEMCQQRGDAGAFAELAAQYGRQVGAEPPPWSQSLSRGRGLDTCTSVMAHLQVVWPDPLAAMQMVQDLLARGGGPGVQQFELPAYGDLLMLYGVARDLFEAGQRSEGVDLMLPLDSQFGEPR